MLPHAGTLDLFDRAVWERLLEADAPETRGLFGSGAASTKSAGFRWSIPDPSALAKARTLASAIRNSPLDPARVVYVAGTADETACDLEIDEQAKVGRRVKVIASSRGDGRVLWETGIPANIRTFFMDTVHGDLANDRRHFPALVDLLNTGTTAKLPPTPRVARGGDERFEMRERLPAMVPDEAELVSEVLGGRRADVEARAEQARISVRVIHDNLTNARSPVLASHYRFDVIVAAEAYLDRQLNHRLSELLRMELYPGPINTGTVVVNDSAPDDLSIHPGAIIAGLGNVGELTPGSLTSTLAYALTLYGAECVGRERRRRQREGAGLELGGTVSAPVTAILVGSGEGGVTLADSVRALLRAVQLANHRLRGGAESSANGDGGATKLISQIDRLDILELYEDRAIEALHVLRSLSSAPEFDDYVVEELLAKGPGGQRRVRFEQASSWWQRIRVKGKKSGVLEFEAVTQTARAPARLLPTQRGLVDGFIDRAIETTASDLKLGHTLFELLVPNDFKPYAPDRRKLALMLNPAAAAIPWELMHDGFDRSAEPMAVASGMIRQLLLSDERAHVLRSPNNTALVVGNPKVDDRRFPSLSGAAEEASRVAGLLSDERGYDVTLLLEEGADPLSVLSAVHEKPWRILHLAAHGVFEFDREDGKGPVSGLVLGDGLFFTAAEADQLRYVPELVFINCCHLGQMRGDSPPRVAFHKLAANLATQFIKMGARAVVAAGWAVDDAAAKTFATAFYSRLLKGDLYGDAVLQARSDTYRMHGETNTWGAYQCYGDPSFSLSAGRPQYREDVFVSESELATWLERHAATVRERGCSDVLLAELEVREAQTPAAWWDSADLCARSGHAFAELGSFERAIYYYERVVRAEVASAPIKTLEQLASCKVRWAGSLVQPDPDAKREPDVKKASRLLKEAEDAIRHLLGLGETSERWSLLGSVMKRRALLPSKNGARHKALQEMSAAYKAAYDLSTKNNAPDAYPLGNQIAADVVLSWGPKDTSKERVIAVQASLEALAEVADTLARTRTDTFNLLAAADRLLLDALVRRSLDDTARARIQVKFAAALSRGATARERDSIRTQFRFFTNLMQTEFPSAGRKEMMGQMALLEQGVLG